MEIHSRCGVIKAILHQPCSARSTIDVQSVLRELKDTLEACVSLLQRFQDSSQFIRFIWAHEYDKGFISVHERLLRKAADLQLVWAGDTNRRVIDLQAALLRQEQISAALLSKFEHVAFAIVKNSVEHTDELLSQPGDVQATIVDNLQWPAPSVAQGVKQALAELSQQKAAGQGSYKRMARGRLERALESALPDRIDPGRLTVDFADVIGSGSFGMVCGAQLRGVGDVAVKLIPKTEAATPFFREVASLQLVATGRDVLKLHGWSELTHPQTKVVYLALVTERCSRSLASVIADSSVEPELLQWLQWLQQTVAGMAVVAAKGMLHRDLKPENVLITKDGRAVVADFGLAVTRSTVLQATVRQDAYSGTVGFTAPEVFSGKLSESSDVYAYGVLARCALLGMFPWQDSHGHPLPPEAIRRMCESAPPPRCITKELFGELLPDSCIAMMLNACCNVDPALRTSFVELQLELQDVCTQLGGGTSTPVPPPPPSNPSQQQQTLRQVCLIDCRYALYGCFLTSIVACRKHLVMKELNLEQRLLHCFSRREWAIDQP